LRQTFYLQPNESAAITFATAARPTKSELREAIAKLTANHSEQAFAKRDNDLATPTPSLPGHRAPAPHEAPTNGDASSPHRIDAAHRHEQAAYHRLNKSAANNGDAEPSFSEQLQFNNGIGGFTARGDEYVIRLRPGADGRFKLPPLPWSHVVANPNAGFITTERGAGYTWTANSRENRLTHWSNDPVSDPHSEALYLRDHTSREFWSPLPGPAEAPVPNEVRYGFGYVRYSQNSAGLDQRILQFVPVEDPVKITRVSLQNETNAARQLDAFFYAHLALGNGESKSRGAISTWLDDETDALFAINPSRELAHRVAFAAIIAPTGTGRLEYTANRREFIGESRGLSNPIGVTSRIRLSNQCGEPTDACFALKQPLQLNAGESADYWILLGETDSAEQARELIRRYSDPAALDQAFAEARQSWQRLLNAVKIETPSPALNLMVNGWLPYQNISCRLWGRSAYYQSGGAFGFRDQLQDSAALVYHDPTITRQQILRNASNQFIEGDVLHWWHPPMSRGIRTRFADDLLWLPLIASEYAATTGDAQIWDEMAPFFTGPQLDPGEQERFFTPRDSGERGTIYEHCCRAIDRSLALGAHGLPLFGCGDWNDGMNRVGAAGCGESVWMGFFLYHVLDRFIPACRLRGDEARANRYREHQQRLRDALNTAGWDGQWYRRAYFDDGTPLGTASADECQIDALVQAWAVLSGAGDPEKSEQAMSAVEDRLVRPDHRVIQLLDPPFDRMPHDPGYIKGYLPGIRENGGQYTHGVLWFVRAMAELGRGSRAVELLEMLNPVNHGRTPEEVAVYQAEPYVIAADVYSQPPHAGRAGWTWYTGSAGWMLRIAVESILGLSIHEGRELRLNPCISKNWPSCSLRYRTPSGAEYRITIENPNGREHGVATAFLDGKPAEVVDQIARIPIAADGSHEVIVRL
jgi:cyclic beta-1,2-glucan synthetase